LPAGLQTCVGDFSFSSPTRTPKAAACIDGSTVHGSAVSQAGMRRRAHPPLKSGDRTQRSSTRDGVMQPSDMQQSSGHIVLLCRADCWADIVLGMTACTRHLQQQARSRYCGGDYEVLERTDPTHRPPRLWLTAASQGHGIMQISGAMDAGGLGPRQASIPRYI
jgi:hypothetical protein